MLTVRFPGWRGQAIIHVMDANKSRHYNFFMFRKTPARTVQGKAGAGVKLSTENGEKSVKPPIMVWYMLVCSLQRRTPKLT